MLLSSASVLNLLHGFIRTPFIQTEPMNNRIHLTFLNSANEYLNIIDFLEWNIHIKDHDIKDINKDKIPQHLRKNYD